MTIEAKPGDGQVTPEPITVEAAALGLYGTPEEKAAAKGTPEPTPAEKAATDQAAADKLAADTKAAADAKALEDKTAADAKAAQDKLDADKKAADDLARAEADKGKTPEQLATEKAAREAQEKADKDAAEKKAAEDKAKQGPPEKYTIKVPAGFEQMLDNDDLKALEGKARAKGLNNEALQTVVNEMAAERAEQSAVFRAQVEADPALGGDRLPETERLAKIAMDKLHPKGTAAGDEFRSFLNKSGYGNNIHVVRHMVQLGKLMADDCVTIGRAGSTGEESQADRMYPKTKA